LKADFDAYMRHLAGGDVLDEADFRPLQKTSIETRTQQLRRYLSALVHRGRDPQSLEFLADAVHIDTVKDGLRFLLDRSDGKPSKQMLDIACVVTAVARHWVKIDDRRLAGLKSICANIKQRLNGQTPDGDRPGRAWSGSVSFRTRPTSPP
jgi:hypothetical protein